LKGASNEEDVDDVVAEVVMSGLVDNKAGGKMSILNIWSVETPDILHSCKKSGRATRGVPMLTVNNCIKVRL
jgi:hypothetical protein